MNRKIEFEANRLLDLTCCTDLPIDVHKIARHCGYNVRNYSACKALIKRLSLDELVTKYRSVSFMYDNAYYILLSDSLTKDEERKLIAHEIGHIKLHSLNRCGVVGHGDGVCDTVARENEADTFALHLLAPLPLLCEQKIKDPSCIKDLTGLSLVDCRTVFESLREYRYECCVINGRNRLLERSKSYAHNIWKGIFVVGLLSMIGIIHHFIKEEKEYHIFRISPSRWTNPTRFTENLTYLRNYYSRGKDEGNLHDECIIVDSVKYYSAHIKAKEKVITVFGSTKEFAEYYRSLPPYYANDLLDDILHGQTILFLKDSKWDYEETGLPENEINHFEKIRYKLQKAEFDE